MCYILRNDIYSLFLYLFPYVSRSNKINYFSTHVTSFYYFFFIEHPVHIRIQILIINTFAFFLDRIQKLFDFNERKKEREQHILNIYRTIVLFFPSQLILMFSVLTEIFSSWKKNLVTFLAYKNRITSRFNDIYCQI